MSSSLEHSQESSPSPSMPQQESKPPSQSSESSSEPGHSPTMTEEDPQEEQPLEEEPLEKPFSEEDPLEVELPPPAFTVRGPPPENRWRVSRGPHHSRHQPVLEQALASGYSGSSSALASQEERVPLLQDAPPGAEGNVIHDDDVVVRGDRPLPPYFPPPRLADHRQLIHNLESAENVFKVVIWQKAQFAQANLIGSVDRWNDTLKYYRQKYPANWWIFGNGSPWTAQRVQEIEDKLLPTIRVVETSAIALRKAARESEEKGNESELWKKLQAWWFEKKARWTAERLKKEVRKWNGSMGMADCEYEVIQ